MYFTHLISSNEQSFDSLAAKLLQLMSIDEDEIAKHRGVDAAQYLAFQRYIIYFLIFLSIICLILVLPINTQGEESK